MEAVRSVQESQSEQLRQVTEAAMQSVQQAAHLIEAAAVSEGNRRDLTSRKNRHRSVTPFGRAAASREVGENEEDAQVQDAMESEKPIESFTFDRFYPGNANAFTYKISQAVANAPGVDYNPLFLFGDVGVGKTHLISAMGNAVLNKHPEYRVGYVSASHFARRLVLATEDQALEEFRENYSHWDMLILDDIQFLGGRIEAQEEFFHIFNVLRQQGRQIIIASDKAPDRLGLLEQRLVSRFASGIVAQLKAPEWEVRMEILRSHARESGKKIPEEILSLIAMRVPHDIRKMTGSLGKLVAFANLVGQDMSCELADEILSHLGADEAA
jgi:chromosomal replication initiator protein